MPTPARLGLVRDLPIETYHDDATSISNSGLLDLARSPLHYHALHINPLRPPRVAKAGQLEGSLAHCMALEAEAFFARYVLGPTCNRNTKKWHEFVEAEAQGDKRVCIQEDQYDVARAQALSLRSLDELGGLLSEGEAEVSAYWIDATNGVLCRCRPDWNSPVGSRDEGVILVDLKTCSDASPAEFARQVARKSYHLQAAFYSDGFEAASGKRVMGFVFAAVEGAWPFAACAAMLDDDSLNAGRREYRQLLDLYATCRERDEWPGYSEGIELISLPAWRMKS